MKKKFIKGKVNLKIVMDTIYTWSTVGILLFLQIIVLLVLYWVWFFFKQKTKNMFLQIVRFFVKLWFFFYFISDFTIDFSLITKNTNKIRIYILNHASSFDTFIMYHLPGNLRTIVKEQYAQIPVLAWGLKMSGSIQVKERKNDPEKDNNHLFDDALNEIQKGSAILIYPEGTRSKDGNISRFKSGAFLMAYETQAEIVPVVMDSWESLRPGAWWVRDKKTHVKALPAIQYEEYKDKDMLDFKKELQVYMTDELLKIRNMRRIKEHDYYRHKKVYEEYDEKMKKYVEKNKKMEPVL